MGIAQLDGSSGRLGAGAWWSDPATTQRRVLALAGPPVLILLAQALLFPAPAAIWLLGAELGLLTALVALGMALVYRANRILNFAQADLGTAPGGAGHNAHHHLGVELLPRPRHRPGWRRWAVGALVEVLIIRRFFRAPRLILTVATIGLSQLFTVVGLLLFRQKQVNAATGAGSENALANLSVKAPFKLDFTLGPRLFTANDVIALVVAPLVVVALAVFLKRTVVGVALRAAAERADRASLLGIPVKRLQMLVWSLATVMSFAGLFLRAGVVGLPAVSTASLAALASALTALMVGRLTNLPAITAAAVALGVLEQGRRLEQRQQPQRRVPGAGGGHRPGPGGSAGSGPAAPSRTPWPAGPRPRRSVPSRWSCAGCPRCRWSGGEAPPCCWPAPWSHPT